MPHFATFIATLVTLIAAIAGTVVVPVAATAQAQDFSTRPIRLIIAFPPGGPAEVVRDKGIEEPG